MRKMYDVSSKRGDEFIHHGEIIETLTFAEENKKNEALIDTVLNKARLGQGLSHREASLLLACELEEKIGEIFRLAKRIKIDIYGKRIVMFAPLYLSNYCVNGCLYCPYQFQNKMMPRIQLSQEEIRREVIALQDMGHKRLALEAGEDPIHNTMDYYLESIETIYKIKHKNGAIRRVNINIAATTIENYRLLKEAEIGTYLLFQETYHKENYLKLHPTGPKHDYNYHTEAMDRAMAAGIDDVGIGVLFGLENYAYDFVGLLMHGEHLEATFGVGPHTISVPRVRQAQNIDSSRFGKGINDKVFEKIVACLRIAVPYAGIIVSTRESKACRERVLEIGVSQISGGSKTSVGGYSDSGAKEKESSFDTCDSSLNTGDSSLEHEMSLANRTESKWTQSEQFEVYDNRSLDEIVNWLISFGYIPSFCTACYKEGRTGDRFMELCKSGQLWNVCHSNSLMTLQEYAMDYASPETKRLAEALIHSEIENVPNEKVRKIVLENLRLISEKNGRDFRL